MSKFLGGSAYAMARDIAEGFHLVTERTFRGMQRSDLDQLAFEIDRQLREIRGTQPAVDDLTAVQARNRKIQRLSAVVSMLRAHRRRTAAPPVRSGR